MKNDNLLTLLPDTIQKSRIIEQSRVVRKELEDSTIAVYKSASGVFRAKDLSSHETNDLQKTYERLTGRKQSIIDDVGVALENLNVNLETMESIVQKTFPEDIVKASISVKELNTLQFVGITSFISRYARKLLAYFYACESSVFNESSLKLDESFSKADVKWIKDNFLDFVNALGSLSIKTNQLEKIFKTLPDINVSPENVRSVFALQSNSKIDPLRLQNFNVTNNFVYRLMLGWAEFQADRYKLALEEKRMLEYRLLLLKRQREGKADARLEKEIAILEDRIARLAYKIKKAEDDND